MHRFIAIALACAVLAGCNKDEKRAHERQLQRQQQQHELALRDREIAARAETDKLRVASDERVRRLEVEREAQIRSEEAAHSAKNVEAAIDVGKVLGALFIIGAVIGSIFYLIVELLRTRLKYLRDWRMKQEEEKTKQVSDLVTMIANPNSGMSPEDRLRAFRIAVQAVGGALPYDPNVR